jgi:hypothetical protein
MFLLDTNIWLELLLEQEKADQVRRPQPSARKLQRLPLPARPGWGKRRRRSTLSPKGERASFPSGG